VERALAESEAILRAAGVEDGRLEAELLLAGTLGVTRSVLRMDPGRVLDEADATAFGAAVERRSRHEPVQYILGRAAFRTLELRVDERVLIPRPETEELVGGVLDWAGARDRWGRALDVGTGSGAIALSLAAEGRFRQIVATDASPDALEIAAANARRLELDSLIEFRAGALWTALEAGSRFDIIISNPPYIAESERAGLMPEVRDWEPPLALIAPEGGVGMLYALVDGAVEWLNDGGLLALELAPWQAGVVSERAVASGYEGIRVLRDLAGRERIILAERGRIARRGITG
jgi:release factor glutamine methyltransferase